MQSACAGGLLDYIDAWRRHDVQGEKIAYLREYSTTAPLYDWTGLRHYGNTLT